jgi:hypothetical protein
MYIENIEVVNELNSELIEVFGDDTNSFSYMTDGVHELI